MLALDMSIRIANAPCSWGVVMGVEGQEALIWRRVLDEMATTGYAGTELGDWGFMPDDPDLLREELRRRSLAMIGAFTPVRLSDPTAHTDGETRALRTARLLAELDGDAFIVLADDPGPDSHRRQVAGRIRPEHGLDATGWKNVAIGTERIAKAVREATGIRTVFHHHCATFIETPEETARLMEMTNPDLVGLCLDTGHYYYGGGDPIAALRTYAGRAWLVHFKDCDAAIATQARSEGWDYLRALRNGLFCGLGEGAIDHAAAVDELRRSGYQGWIVVENESPPGRVPALTMARNDRSFLTGVRL
jgi:inosose dehydratase